MSPAIEAVWGRATRRVRTEATRGIELWWRRSWEVTGATAATTTGGGAHRDSSMTAERGERKTGERSRRTSSSPGSCRARRRSLGRSESSAMSTASSGRPWGGEVDSVVLGASRQARFGEKDAGDEARRRVADTERDGEQPDGVGAAERSGPGRVG